MVTIIYLSVRVLIILEMPLSKCHFGNTTIEYNDITTKQVISMIICFQNANEITYRKQTVYKNERSFYTAMLDLIRQNIMREKNLHTYELTKNGLFYVKHITLR